MDDFSPQIHDLTRKFFAHLLRHEQVAKAFQLAVDLDDYDLFMDLHHAANRMGLAELAQASAIKANALYNDELSSEEDEGQPGRGHPISSEPGRVGQVRNYSLPSPMQLFSSVTTVQVEHPGSSSQEPVEIPPQDGVEEEEASARMSSERFTRPPLEAAEVPNDPLPEEINIARIDIGGGIGDTDKHGFQVRPQAKELTEENAYENQSHAQQAYNQSYSVTYPTYAQSGGTQAQSVVSSSVSTFQPPHDAIYSTTTSAQKISTQDFQVRQQNFCHCTVETLSSTVCNIILS